MLQGEIERRIPSKKKLKPIPGAYRAARKATWGALWPNWIGVNDHHRNNKQAILDQQAAMDDVSSLSTDAVVSVCSLLSQ